MFSKKHLSIEGQERIMVVGANNKGGDKKILWHSNDKVYGAKITCDNRVAQTEANVYYSVDKVEYEFWIDAPGFLDSQKVVMDIPTTKSLATDASILKEKYTTALEATDAQKRANYYYYPNMNLINEIDIDSDHPTIFNVNNPINIVYYSGCTFVKSPTMKMPPYIPAIGLDVVGLTWTSWTSTTTNSLGQGVVAEGDPFMKYTYEAGKLPMVNWGPTDVYWKLDGYYDSVAEIEAAFNALYPRPSKTKYLQAANGKYYGWYSAEQHVDLKNDGNCFEYGGNDATPSGDAGYHWVSGDRVSAITDDKRSIDTTQLHGPIDGRVIGYFRFDSRMNEDLFFNQADGTYHSYIIHWHPYFQMNSEWESRRNYCGYIAMPTDKIPMSTNCETYGITYTYTKSSDGKYTFSPTYQKDQRPQYDRWYAIIVDPIQWPNMSTFKQSSLVSKTGSVSLMEIYDENGILKEEHRDYIGSCMAERFCKKVGKTYTFYIQIGSTTRSWTCDQSIIRRFFNEDGEVVSLVDKNGLMAYDSTVLYSPTKNLCTEVEATSSKKQIFNSSNPICIPEMSGVKFVEI